MVYRIHGIIFISMGIKTLNLYLSASLSTTLTQLLAQKAQLFPGLLALHCGPGPLFLFSTIQCHNLVVSGPVPDSHKVSPRNPRSPRSCSVVLCVGVLEPKCSELEVSAKTPGGNR